ncbi:hypothetical protein DEH69_11880 [Streptomyces sp. PT12]|nr:hypothetical protein DEH69_11880 [Streptomyces sp. PT12]
MPGQRPPPGALFRPPRDRRPPGTRWIANGSVRDADIDLRWDSVRFAITTHDAGHRLTAADFDLAERINAIAAAHDARPLD